MKRAGKTQCVGHLRDVHSSAGQIVIRPGQAELVVKFLWRTAGDGFKNSPEMGFGEIDHGSHPGNRKSAIQPMMHLGNDGLNEVLVPTFQIMFVVVRLPLVQQRLKLGTRQTLTRGMQSTKIAHKSIVKALFLVP